MSDWSAAPSLAGFVSFIQNGMQIPPAALPANVPAPAMPALSAAPGGGSLPTGTVYVRITYVTAYGETTASPEASIAVTGPTGQVTVPSPSQPGAVTGWNVYAASATGAEVLQTATPVAIGTAYAINSLATGGATPPSASTANSPWVTWAYNQALALTLFIPTVAGLSYTTALYNGAGHILLTITPDQTGQTFVQDQVKAYGLLAPSSGVISASSDQGTANSFTVPEQFTNFTVEDLNFFRTPYGRTFLAYHQSFGEICGLT